MSEGDYNQQYDELSRKREREQNMLLLLRLRPGAFDADDQARSEEINADIKLTAIGVFGGFMTTSAFRVWQIHSRNQSIPIGLAIIIFSYLPSYVYYNK